MGTRCDWHDEAQPSTTDSRMIPAETLVIGSLSASMSSVPLFRQKSINGASTKPSITFLFGEQ